MKKNNRSHILMWLLLCTCWFSCSKKGASGGEEPPPPPNTCVYLGVDTCQQQPKTIVTVNLNEVKQTIHSFGASDCWTAKYIGKWNDVQKKNQIADLLFSTDTLQDGSPKGIGLTLWRFNIGGGSFEQGTSSNIADEWRREECFLNADGSYDWTKQAGQQWFLQAAKQRGIKYTVGFSLTPPVHMSRNGKAYNSSGGIVMNLQDGKMDAYADFMAEVTKHFQFDYLSPVNEPQWTWGQATSAGQEGTQATNAELAALVKALSPKLAATSSKVVIGEAAQWDFLTGRNNDGRGDQINQFFTPASANYIGNLPAVEKAISAHSYFTTCPDDNMINVRKQVVAKINQVDASLPVWQTEFGILGDICGKYNGYPRNTSIDYGLYVAKVLHHDLAITNVTSWHWWLAISPYNYSDALVYINDPAGQMNVNNCKQDGIVLDSKQLWSFGNYARFIRPGMKRITANVQGITDAVTAANTLMISAYKDETSKKLVVVVVNPEAKDKILELKGENSSLNLTGNAVAVYTTDFAYNLKRTANALNNIVVPARSVVTLAGTIQ
ncbi:glycoside hydrolase [Longitalea luteola]|uniref:glycoside hydrolase n=1 Tax=Longitalea luteola TaxID=2812563 RepID=UPI001A979DED|nr:glycoside hydrolase [Longitalea luteola]